MNLNNTLLNEGLDEEVYINIRRGHNVTHQGKMYRFRKSLSSIRQ